MRTCYLLGLLAALNLAAAPGMAPDRAQTNATITTSTLTKADGVPVELEEVASIYADATAVWTFNEPNGFQGLGLEGNDSYAGHAADMEKDNFQYATIVDNSDFDPGAAGRGFCVWLRPETLTSNDYLLSKATGVAAGSDFNVFVSSGGVVTLSFIDSSGAGTISVGSGTAFLSADARTFLCGWWDGGGDDKAHLEINSDANIKTGASTMAAANNGTANFYVAAISSQLGDYDGSVGPLIWYENGIPDTTIRASLYNSGKGKSCANMTAADQTNAVGCWEMGEDGGPYVDSIGSNDLAGQNTPTRATGLIITGTGDPSLYLTPVNTPTATGGALGYAADFESVSSQAAYIDDNPSTSIGSNIDFAFCGWVQVESNVAGCYGPVGKGNGHWFLSETASDYQVLIYDSVSGFTNATINDNSNVAGARNFVCGYYTASTGFASIYVNGTTATDTAGPITQPIDGTAAFTVQARLATGGNACDGEAGPIWLYKTTLPDFDALYNSGKGLTCAETVSGGFGVGLESCWEMEEAGGPYVDSVESNTLTAVNTPTQANGLVERSDSGMSVNLVRASVQALTLADNAALSLGADTDMCLAAWINPTVVNVAQFFVAKGTGSTVPDVEYWLYALSDDARFGVGDGTNFRYAQVTGGLAANEWHLMIGCHDSTLDLVTVEVNAVEATTAHSSGTQDLAGVFAVGQGGSADTNFADAAIDNVAVWKRVLSASEKATFWNAGAGTFYAAFMDFIFDGPRFAWSQKPEHKRLAWN